MTGRADTGMYVQAFDVENRASLRSRDYSRLVAVTDTRRLSVTRFIYDGDGNRVLTVYPDGSQTAFVGDHYEVEGSTARSYYFPSASLRTGLGSQRVAMRVDDGATEDAYWFHTDHPSASLRTGPSASLRTGPSASLRTGFGSTSLLSLGFARDAAQSTISGTLAAESETRFLPYGEYRVEPTAGLTDHGYTGHKQLDCVGLVDMRARWYSPTARRFIQPDTTIPNPSHPQSFNRYSYVSNRPLSYADPTGHAACISSDCRLVVNPANGNVVVRQIGDSVLYALVARIAQGRDAAVNGLEQVLDETQGAGMTNWPKTDRFLGGLTRTHFRGLGSVPGDTGFANEFRDDHLYTSIWGYDAPTSRQTGHFLTAVDMGYHEGWIHSIVGHELHSDSGLGVLAQLLAPKRSDISNFESAIEADEQGLYGARDEALSLVMNTDEHGPISERKGNSMEDLRLGVRGWRLGGMVANGQLQTNKDLANWIALNVAGE